MLASSLLAGVEMIVRGIYSGNRQVWITHRKLISNLMPAVVDCGHLVGVDSQLLCNQFIAGIAGGLSTGHAFDCFGSGWSDDHSGFAVAVDFILLFVVSQLTSELFCSCTV